MERIAAFSRCAPRKGRVTGSAAVQRFCHRNGSASTWMLLADGSACHFQKDGMCISIALWCVQAKTENGAGECLLHFYRWGGKNHTVKYNRKNLKKEVQAEYNWNKSQKLRGNTKHFSIGIPARSWQSVLLSNTVQVEHRRVPAISAARPPEVQVKPDAGSLAFLPGLRSAATWGVSLGAYSLVCCCA